MEKHTHTGLIICLGRGPSRPRLLDKKQTHTIQETTVASDSVSIHEGATPLAPPTAPRLYSRTAANLPTPPHPRRHAPRGREGSKTQAAGVIVSRHTPAATRRGGVGRAGPPSPAQEQARYTQRVITTSSATSTHGVFPSYGFQIAGSGDAIHCETDRDSTHWTGWDTQDIDAGYRERKYWERLRKTGACKIIERRLQRIALVDYVSSRDRN
jgi:hypothetical protein